MIYIFCNHEYPCQPSGSFLGLVCNTFLLSLPMFYWYFIYSHGSKYHLYPDGPQIYVSSPFLLPEFNYMLGFSTWMIHVYLKFSVSWTLDSPPHPTCFSSYLFLIREQLPYMQICRNHPCFFFVPHPISALYQSLAILVDSFYNIAGSCPFPLLSTSCKLWYSLIWSNAVVS